MLDGVYTPFGLRELPQEESCRENSPYALRSLGAFLSLAAMMFWMTLTGFFRGLRRQ